MLAHLHTCSSPAVQRPGLSSLWAGGLGVWGGEGEDRGGGVITSSLGRQGLRLPAKLQSEHASFAACPALAPHSDTTPHSWNPIPGGGRHAYLYVCITLCTQGAKWHLELEVQL